MPLNELRGNLFNSNAQTLVNTVNCVGVMGNGVALEFRRRFPKMFEAYRVACRDHALHPGQILPYSKSRPWVLNFAVKDDWRDPSQLEWVESCLDRFVRHYQRLKITSVAFPWIGAMNGRLPWEQVRDLMRRYLEPLDDIRIEIIEFDPDIPDALFRRIHQATRTLDASAFARHTGITEQAAELVYQAAGTVPSLTRLCEFPGLGRDTVERLYARFR